jgi:hypothetical protein
VSHRLPGQVRQIQIQIQRRIDMAHADIDLVRSKADEVVKLANSDPAFAKRLTDQPEDTLRSIGLPEWAIDHAASEIRFPEEDVSGYLKCRMTCDEITCWITACTFYTGR